MNMNSKNKHKKMNSDRYTCDYKTIRIGGKLYRYVSLDTVMDYGLYALVNMNVLEIPEIKYRKTLIKILEELPKHGYLPEDDFNSSGISDTYASEIDMLKTFDLIRLSSDFLIVIDKKKFMKMFEKVHKRIDQKLLDIVRSYFEKWVQEK